jgi:hypothetical protein
LYVAAKTKKKSRKARGEAYDLVCPSLRLAAGQLLDAVAWSEGVDVVRKGDARVFDGGGI